MYGYTLNERCRKRKGETIEEIQLPNQSLQEFDSINRGKMQYQTDLKRGLEISSMIGSVCVKMNQRFLL